MVFITFISGRPSAGQACWNITIQPLPRLHWWMVFLKQHWLMKSLLPIQKPAPISQHIGSHVTRMRHWFYRLHWLHWLRWTNWFWLNAFVYIDFIDFIYFIAFNLIDFIDYYAAVIQATALHQRTSSKTLKWRSARASRIPEKAHAMHHFARASRLPKKACAMHHLLMSAALYKTKANISKCENS